MTTTKWCDTCGEQMNDEHACNEWSIHMTTTTTYEEPNVWPRYAMDTHEEYRPNGQYTKVTYHVVDTEDNDREIAVFPEDQRTEADDLMFDLNHGEAEGQGTMTQENVLHVRVGHVNEGRLACDTCGRGDLVVTSALNKWESLKNHDGYFITDTYEYGDTEWNNHIACDSCEAGPSETMVATIKRMLPGMVWAAEPKTVEQLHERYANANPETQEDNFNPNHALTCPLCEHDAVGFMHVVVVDEAIMLDHEEAGLTVEQFQEPAEEVGSSLECGYCGAIMGAKRRDWISEHAM